VDFNRFIVYLFVAIGFLSLSDAALFAKTFTVSKTGQEAITFTKQIKGSTASEVRLVEVYIPVRSEDPTASGNFLRSRSFLEIRSNTLESTLHVVPAPFDLRSLITKQVFPFHFFW
jgi:hypothetical protein